MRQDVRTRIVTFVALAFALSWGSFYLLRPMVSGQAGIAVYVVFMFGPLVAALLTSIAFDRDKVIPSLALRPRFNLWWLVAWTAPALIIGLAWAVSLLMPGAEARSLTDGMVAIARQQGTELDATMLAQIPPVWVFLSLSVIAGGAINTFAAMGEEAGWRGYLWTLLRPFGFWRAALTTGVIWGLWHAPVIVDGHNYGTGYAGFPWLGIGMMVIFTTALSPLMGLIRDRTGTSWAPALFHGTINAASGVIVLLVAGGHPLAVGVPGLAGVIVLIAATALVALVRPNGRTPIDPASGRPQSITSG